MGRFDEAADKAAKMTDAELAGKFESLCADPDKVVTLDMPNEQQALIAELVMSVNSETNANKKKQIIKQFMSDAAVELIKNAKKALLVALLALWAIPASAALKEAPVIDFMPFLENLGVCTIYTNQKDFLAGACYAPLTWKWGSVNGGVVWDTNGADKSVGGGFGAVSFRADMAWAWAWRGMNLEKRGFKVHFKVPEIEIGPMGGYLQHKGWVYGGFINGKIPFGGSDD